ncbi:MAG: hypothetical protein JRI68_07365, partial [Deltaproteobacteria bacterium]|nr:hypothetical protein [Deltaproteobacteria bacterium]
AGGLGGSGGGTGATGGTGGAGGALPNPTGTPLWSVAFLGDGDDVGLAIAVDDVGDVFVAGELRTQLTIGNQDLTGDGSDDVFVAKLAGATGAVLWARAFTGPSGDGVGDIAVDGQGNVVVVGTFRNTLTIGGDQHSTPQLSPSIYLARLDGATGAPQDSAAFGSTAAQQYGNDLAVDGSGAILITGTFRGSFDFGDTTLTSAGAEDIYLAKLSGESFAEVWAQDWGASGDQSAHALAVNGQGQIWLGGEFDSPFSMDLHNLPLDAGIDLFLAQLAGATGSPNWHLAVGGANRQVVHGLAVGPVGEIWACGNTQGDVDFGGGVLPYASGNGDDVFVMKRTPSGTHVYSDVVGDSDDQDGRGIAVDLAGNAIVVGELEGTINFGGGDLASDGARNDIFIAKLGPQGDHLWSYRFGDAERDNADAVATGPDGSVFVTGRFESTVTFGDLPTLTGGLNEEVFVAKLAY